MGNHEAGYCGDFCGKCPNHAIKCRGCIAANHAACFFVRCCLAKSIEHCGFCADFPCTKLQEFVPDDRPQCPKGYHIANLRERKTIGTEAWLESQWKKWKSQ